MISQKLSMKKMADCNGSAAEEKPMVWSNQVQNGWLYMPYRMPLANFEAAVLDVNHKMGGGSGAEG